MFDVCCVLAVHNILYKFDIHNGMASLKFVASVQLLNPALLKCKRIYLNFSFNTFFYTVHPFSSTDRNKLIIHSSVMFTYLTRRQEIEGVALLI